MTRPHKYEMIRFAKSEEGTAVWFKRETATNWRKTREPRWHKDSIYIIDNEYAELRKEGIDKDRPIQLYHRLYSEWITPGRELEFCFDIEYYRVAPKEEEFQYPIYKLCNISDCVVKFISKNKGAIVIGPDKSNGEVSKWVPHTDTFIWKDYDYVELNNTKNTNSQKDKI